MATTTNYGWTTPDDTALVKDGAAAIRTLGSSVDTTTKNLNPSTTLGDIEYRSSTANTNTRLGIGTSGQALTVVAGAPSWAASPTSVLTTTGDSLYASAANTLARLGIGTTGQVLTVSGGVPAWTTVSSGGMTLLSTTTLSGATTTISSIPTTYNYLKMIIVGARVDTSPENFGMRINSDTGSNYTIGRIYVNGSTLSGSADLNQDQIYLGYGVGYQTGVQKLLHGNFEITNYASASGGILVSGGTQNYVGSTHSRGTINSVYDNSAACTSITFLTSGGRSFQSGTVYLYGVK